MYEYNPYWAITLLGNVMVRTLLPLLIVCVKDAPNPLILHAGDYSFSWDGNVTFNKELALNAFVLFILKV